MSGRDQGVNYPANAKGERKSTDTNRAVFAAAAEVVDKKLAVRKKPP